MSKRPHAAAFSSSSSSSSSKKARRQISLNTFKKWQVQYENLYQSLSWLRCDIDKSDKSLVDSLWCGVCRQHEDRLRGMKNYSSVWINGSGNHKTSSLVDHAKSDQHKAAMIQFRRASGQSLTTYSPIAQSLLVMDEVILECMKRKFDISFILAKEGLAFKKYPILCELESRHGIDHGHAYNTKDSAKAFVHYIAESQRQLFISSLSSSRFYSFLMDGSTDAGNVEDEVIVILTSTRDEVTQEIKSCARFLSVEVPTKADADGLIQSLSRGLSPLGVTNVLDKSNVLGAKPILVGGGTDGASVNIAEQNGMKGKLQRELPWVSWAWCFAHRLELACKDSLSSKLFKDIDEMLLRLYYLYEKSPKKSRELEDIVTDLKEVYEFPDGGNLPVRSQGSRWISHKRKALQRVVDRYGAYINHILALTEDRSIRGETRAQLKGFLLKWRSANMLVGAAMYVEVLKAPSILSLNLQDKSLDVVAGIKAILKASKSLMSLMEMDPLEWPTVKLVHGRISDEDEEKLYQGAALHKYSQTLLDHCCKEALEDLSRIDKEMRNRLQWSDVQLLRSIVVFLDTPGWHHLSDDSEEEADDRSLTEVKSAVEYIVSLFREPLEASDVDLAYIQDEVEEVVEYARQYLSTETESYKRIWYKLHVAPDVQKWTNLLALCELLFCLPFSNGHVERIFSTLKVTKTDRRTNLNTSTLRDLLEIKVEGPSLSDFNAKHAVELWWKDCQTTRRVNQAPRKEYRPRVASSSGEEGPLSTSTCASSSSDDTLSDWDNWFDQQ